MKVEDLCTRAVRSCTAETTLAEAGTLLWDLECAALPVVDDAGKVVGMVGDRDICMAAAVTGRPVSSLPVRVALKPSVPTCRLSDDAREALRTMRVHKARRLPVVDGAGVLQGILSLNDLALAAKPDRVAGPADISYEDLALALQAICAPRKTEAPPVAAPQPTTCV